MGKPATGKALKDPNRISNGQFTFGNLVNQARFKDKLTEQLVNSRIAEYFEMDDCPTFTGLALWIGVDSHTFDNWTESRPPWFTAIQKAKDYISASMQNRLIKGRGNIAGIIFWCKNVLKWADRSETNVNQEITLKVDLDNYIKDRKLAITSASKVIEAKK